MKKLAIMFVMLLGSVATMQAQSFDFSCSIAVSGGNSWSALTEEFTPSQMVLLTDDGYVMSEDRNGNEQLAQTFPEVSYTYTYPENPDGSPGAIFTFPTEPIVSVQTGSFYDGRDDSAAALGPFTYRINIRGGTFNDLSFYSSVDEVLAFLLSIYRPAPDSDDDGNGFTYAEEEMLVDASFTTNVGDNYYQIVVGANGYIVISIINGQWNLLYTDVDADFADIEIESNHDTLAEALAAAALITN